MSLRPSQGDRAFRNAFEACTVPTEAFDHRGHLRLAYVYNCEMGEAEAIAAMRSALKRYITAKGVPASKYHETLTTAWVRAVRFIMGNVGRASSFDAFIGADDRLLDPAVMLTHYRRGTLFSDAARTGFVPPDLGAIPPSALPAAQ